MFRNNQDRNVRILFVNEPNRIVPERSVVFSGGFMFLYDPDDMRRGAVEVYPAWRINAVERLDES